MAQNFRYPALIKLNDVTLTDESRGPLSETRDERSVEVQLASGRLRKFIMGIRKNWSVTWDNVAMDAPNTVDGFAGRNEIRALAQSGDALILTIQDGRNPVETYEVFVTEYSDDVVQRRGAGDQFRYNVSLGLREVG